MDLDVPSANLSVGRDRNVPIGNVTSIDNMSTGDTEKNFNNSVLLWLKRGGGSIMLKGVPERRIEVCIE